MTTPTTIAKTCAALGGIALAIGMSSAAMAAQGIDDNDVDVDVVVAEDTQPGFLALTVAGTSTTLTESGSTSDVRQFTGALPTVTVTDTRTVDDIEPGVGWYVLGTSTDFVGHNGQQNIEASHLGWKPKLINAGQSEQVVEGPPVDTVLDADSPNPFGLVDQELLARAIDSQQIAHEHQWTASADLYLRIPVTAAPGGYTATLTLSLFE